MPREISIGMQPDRVIQEPGKKGRKDGTLKIGRAPLKVYKQQSDLDVWLETGKWVQVRSSNVKRISYKAVDKQLKVEFKSDKGSPSVYTYFDVPMSVAKQFFRASSLGKFVHQRLKGHFTYSKG